MTPRGKKTSRCPACGMSISGRKSTCPNCGKMLRESAKFECPSCGELIPKKSKKCPACSAEFSGIPDRAKSEPAKENAADRAAELKETEPTQVKEEDKRFSCPKCSEPLVGTEPKCPKCGHVFKGAFRPRCRTCGAPVKKGLTECPKCSVAAEKISEEVVPATPVPSEPVTEAPVEVSEEKKEASHPCPYCGAILPASFQRCPLCNTNFLEEKAREEVAVPEAEPPEAQRSEDSVPAPKEADAQPPRPSRRRVLKAAKVVTPPKVTQRRVRRRADGVVRASGSGKANGKGTAEGEAFVNGTGVSNGLGSRPKGAPAKRTPRVTRWQFLAVLVAISIVISTFMFLSFTNGSDEFSVDGKYADWDGVTTYGTKIESTASTSNIVEWAIGTRSSDLFLYLKTEARMMSSAEAESYYLFVDSDGSSTTGYVMESIGADYMLKLTGWDDAVSSSSLSQYPQSSDQYNWNAWTSMGSLSHSLDGARLEAGTTMPEELGQSAKFVLVSKDHEDRGSVSYTAPLTGGVLVVKQLPSIEITEDGVLPKSSAVTMLTLRFTCEGVGGRVDEVNPTLTGATLASQEPAFSLEKGEEHEMVIAVDTSTVLDGQFVSAEILSSGIVSSFANVEIIGSGASAYVVSPPPFIAIDGAFADWPGMVSVDQDSTPATSPCTDIDEVGNVSTPNDSYFYVSVEGEMCSGTFVPAIVARPLVPGGGGTIIPTRVTAEDILRIYVDSDRSNSTGKRIVLDSKQIGADQMIEVKGLFGRITSMEEFDYSSSGSWTETADVVEAAKDAKRIEIGISAASIDLSADIDFIVETTSWNGTSDFAIFDPYSTSAATRTWVVDPATDSPWATSMSYQRKMFYDGTNYWSFYFDGANTVYKYSMDGGMNWTQCGSVFTTPGVNETSIWYDSGTSTVYAVGDTSSASNLVSIQTGTVNAQAHTISWANADSGLRTSSFPVAGKNTYICKDSNEYLWILSSNCTQTGPTTYQLSAFKSTETNSTASWVLTGQMMTVSSASEGVKGSIVPAGSGSDVWAIYAYTGNVVSRKYNGAWQAPQTIYAQFGSKINTDNSPPSVVVDAKGVVHVVYGTGRKAGQDSTPTIEYSRNNTDLTTFTAGVSLDPTIPTGVGDYYPTISLEASTNNLYVLWLRSDTTLAPKTVMARKCVSGNWSEMTIEQQTTFTKQYMTSVYSAPGPFNVCWQWTQNTTAPTEVYCDGTMIPEFGDIALPIFGTVIFFAVYARRLRGSKELTR